MPKKAAPKNKSRKTQLLKKEVVFLCSCCAIVFLLFLSAINIQRPSSNKKILGFSTEQNEQNFNRLSAEVDFWKGFLYQTPSYLDGWLELASLEMQLGDLPAAAAFLEKAYQIDPNSEKLQLIQASLGK